MTIAARLAAYYFAFFAHAGAYVSYFALYLAGRGMTAGEIAFAVAMPQAARIAAPAPCWKKIAQNPASIAKPENTTIARRAPG